MAIFSLTHIGDFYTVTLSAVLISPMLFSSNIRKIKVFFLPFNLKGGETLSEKLFIIVMDQEFIQKF